MWDGQYPTPAQNALAAVPYIDLSWRQYITRATTIKHNFVPVLDVFLMVLLKSSFLSAAGAGLQREHHADVALLPDSRLGAHLVLAPGQFDVHIHALPAVCCVDGPDASRSSCVKKKEEEAAALP